MSLESSAGNSTDFVQNLWKSMGFSLPGMVTPTFDVEEIEKRVKDLKAVEGWLKMNLSMLQVTIQGLEMQVSTLSAVKAMGEMAKQASVAQPDAAPADASAQAAMWPWTMMQQMQEQMQQNLSEAAAAAASAVAQESPQTEAAPKAEAKRSKK